jgi:hypothetical protein
MQRCSESIGLIAGALAKAQIELANPEKSLTAHFRAEQLGCRRGPRARLRRASRARARGGAGRFHPPP